MDAISLKMTKTLHMMKADLVEEALHCKECLVPQDSQVFRSVVFVFDITGRLLRKFNKLTFHLVPQ